LAQAGEERGELDEYDVSEGRKVPDIAIGTIFEHNLVVERPAGESPTPILLMVSGGSDSTAMCLLAEEFSTNGLLDRGSITVLHVNHGLRGNDSYNDSLFVEKLAGYCGFRYELRYIDIFSHLDQFGGNVESAGRHLRYEVALEILGDLCEQAGVDVEDGRIWVAHTQDDRVETFFMRAIVGTGPGGFASIRYRNGNIVRPLLETTRIQLRDYICLRMEQTHWHLDDDVVAQAPHGYWREDSTNYDTTGFRSFVRHRLIPVARERNPILGTTLSRTIDLITDESDMLERMVDKVIEDSAEMGEGSVSLQVDALDELEVPLKRRVVYRLCKEVLPISDRIEERHIDIILSSYSRPNFSMDLPGGARVRNEYGKLVFDSREARSGAYGSDSREYSDNVELPVPGHVFIGNDVKVEVSYVDPSEYDDALGYVREHSDSDTIFVDAARLEAACHDNTGGNGADDRINLQITHRKEGDFVCPLGMNGAHKKLSDVFVDKKVRRSARDDALVIRAGESIVWVVGVVVDERFKVDAGSQMLRISVKIV
jgi:tRNA(Ile)-lysidine synthase